MFNFLDSNVDVGHVVSVTELVQILGLAGQTGLDLEHVEKSLSTDLTSVGSEQDVLTCLLLHLVGELDGALNIEVLEKSLCELREAVRVGALLSKDDGEGDGFERVVLQDGELDAGLVGLGTGLVVRATEQEGSDHVAHQVL